MKIFAALLVALSTSCALGGSPPKYNYYVLTPPAAPPSAPEQHQAPPLVLAIDPIELPGYLDRDEVATRTSDYGIVYSNRDRWAEPLSDAFPGILRQCLASRLSPQGISVQARRIGLVPDYALQVELMRFERRDDGHVELRARWTLRSKARLVRAHEVRISEPTASAEGGAAAAALSRAIDRLSAEVASALRPELSAR